MFTPLLFAHWDVWDIWNDQGIFSIRTQNIVRFTFCMCSDGKLLMTTVIVTTLRICSIFVGVIEEYSVLGIFRIFPSPNVLSQKLRMFRILRIFFAHVRQSFQDKDNLFFHIFDNDSSQHVCLVRTFMIIRIIRIFSASGLRIFFS